MEMSNRAMKTARAKSFSDEWFFSRAIERLFLDAVPAFASVTGADARHKSARSLATNIRKCIKSPADADVCAQFRKSYPELEPLMDVLRRTNMPLDLNRRTHALIWLRLAVLSGFRISATVFSEYSRWRAEVHGAYLERKGPNADGKKLTLVKKSVPSPNATLQPKPDAKFSIEEVVFGGRLVDDGNDFRHGWSLISATMPSPKAGAAQRLQHGDAAQMRSGKKSALRVKRSDAQICGSALLKLLRENLVAIAKGPNDGIVRKQRGAIPFESELSRTDLARKLQGIDKRLGEYSESTMLRAVSALVQCPRGKRGGRASKS